ncbi:cytochrome P450 family protein [Rhizoctonia solani 123E]|uniref:Cytochrome P450 family protein n=1 Tax=Rhizoctonia solani 123E TaxID=1423351 RepID=A0A074SEH2_9AGAM|nr:cytochrome P450 family protein [Rhizoctonia solani 123E]
MPLSEQIVSVSHTTILAGLVATIVFTIRRRWKRSHSLLPLPPGPPSYPLIEQLLSMPLSSEHTVFDKQGKDIKSDIISLSMLGNTIVVLNSSQAAIDLLEKKSSIYSDRVCPPMILDPTLMDWRNYVALLPYGNRWKEHRRMMHTWLQKGAARSFQPSQQRQARLLLVRLLNSNSTLDDQFYRTVAATLIRSVYGYELERLDDHFVTGAKEAIDNLARAAMSTNFLVNAFPVLAWVPDWFPWTQWKKTARSFREQKDSIMDETFQWTKDQIAKGSSEPSIVRSLLDSGSSIGIGKEELEDYIKHIAIALFGAGSDTTVSSLKTFVLAMLLFPECQAKAQDEIDRVIGASRLPTFEDKDRLPYVNNLINEVTRWQPVTPLAVPHACTQDDVYRNYRIPKGAIVIGNVWSMSRNTEVYENPECFNPDRFLDLAVPKLPAFGFGRRLCPGIHYAEASIFITVVSILAVYNITKAKDENGQEITPSTEGVAESVVYHPKPFKCVFTPRSDKHQELIAEV